MNVNGSVTQLQAILGQIQPATRPTVAADAGAVPGTKPTARPVAPASSANVTQNGAASFNPNAPRGTYLNILV